MFFGAKTTHHKSFGSKSHGGGHFGHKAAPTGTRRAVVGVPLASGRGDTGVGGPNIEGNTSNPVSNAQRDGQVRDFRGSDALKRKSKSSGIESRKKNKAR